MVVCGSRGEEGEGTGEGVLLPEEEEWAGEIFTEEVVQVVGAPY